MNVLAGVLIALGSAFVTSLLWLAAICKILDSDGDIDPIKVESVAAKRHNKFLEERTVQDRRDFMESWPDDVRMQKQYVTVAAPSRAWMD